MTKLCTCCTASTYRYTCTQYRGVHRLIHRRRSVYIIGENNKADIYNNYLITLPEWFTRTTTADWTMACAGSNTNIHSGSWIRRSKIRKTELSATGTLQGDQPSVCPYILQMPQKCRPHSTKI